ncbi:type 1 fimbrial protein [Deefgea tanakiae]|uniref:Type 1 fimbrial protein n=1 Tax=Deefgea tanakiae TaxID=2865840 RepID=A0ABX8Z8L6_9NEIS|nr:fimbrial protein [Deefgea tanakiae]QZA78918.1 type 1 fimbrial protein [Deefgea tanakiae]
MKNFSKLALVMALSSPLAAFAVDGTITVEGLVTAQSCTINGVAPSGANNMAINLPAVSVKALSSVGATAGLTPLRIKVGGAGEAGCADGKVASISFEYGPNVTADGYLANKALTAPATNVVVQMFNDDGTGIKIGDATTNNTKATISGNTATLEHSVGYRATGKVSAGAVSTSVMYSLSYN